MNLERGAATLFGRDVTAHLGERFDHPAHRTLAKRVVAGDGGIEFLSGEDAGEHAHRRAGIFGVEHLSRFLEAIEAGASDDYPITLDFNFRAEAAHTFEGTSAIGGGGVIYDFAFAFGQGGEYSVAVGD